MKTRLLVMVGMMISTTIFAQKEARDSRKPESGHERMKRELALSDQQCASIKDIDLKYAKKHDEARTRFDKRRLEERETMRSLRLEREREMRKVFTPAQSKKWDEYRALKKDKRHVKGKHPHARKHFGHNRGAKRDSLKHERNKK